MVSFIAFPFVYFNNWIIKKAEVFKMHIKNIVDEAEDKRINGDIVAPTVPTIEVHPKLNDVI